MKDLNAILGLRSDPAPGVLPAADPVPPPSPAPAEPGMPASSLLVRRAGFAILVMLTACATASSPGMPDGVLAPEPSPLERARAFALEAPPEESLGADLKLWATHYHTPILRPAPETNPAAFPLINTKDEPISQPLSQRDWCEAALQGSVAVREGSKLSAYVFVDAKGPEQTNCDQWLGSLSTGVKSATRRARFKPIQDALGCDARNHPLIPFRTIAVDPAVIPLDSVIFVPELRGRNFEMEGRTIAHDGYLFAGDRGGAIRGTHIDVFMVDKAAGPLEDLFASTDTRTFAAHPVDDSDPAAAALKASQSAQCEAASPG